MILAAYIEYFYSHVYVTEIVYFIIFIRLLITYMLFLGQA